MSISYFQTEVAIQPGDERELIAYLVGKKAKSSNPTIMKSVRDLFSDERIREKRDPNNRHSSEVLLLKTDENGTPNGIIVTPVMPNIGYDYSVEAAMDKNFIGYIQYSGGHMSMMCMMPVSIFKACIVKNIDEAVQINDTLRSFFRAVTIDRQVLESQPFTTILYSSDFRKDTLDTNNYTKYTVVSYLQDGDVLIAPNISRWRANTLTSILFDCRLPCRDEAFHTLMLPEILKNVIRDE